MGWCFATINGRLAEIFFEEKRDKPFINAHCYGKESEYPTKKEQQWIKRDTTRFQFKYRNKIYTNKVDGKKILSKPFSWAKKR